MENENPLLDIYPYSNVRLPFAWKNLPRRPTGPGGYDALSAESRWKTVLADGREVWLTALHQYETYAGVVAGLPDTDEVRASPIEGALRTGDQVFECEPSRIAILPPELRTSRVVVVRDGRIEEVAVDFLPGVCSIGTFESDEPVFEGAAGSELVAVWFQDAFGPPQAGHVTRCIQQVAWDEYAGDFYTW